ncbi:hypothetical protein ACFQ9X_13235 [Catenulispora yoronensis]
MDPLQPGDPARISGYEVQGRLGAGGMGVVYLGQAVHGRLVAVKVVARGWRTTRSSARGSAARSPPC